MESNLFRRLNDLVASWQDQVLAATLLNSLNEIFSWNVELRAALSRHASAHAQENSASPVDDV